MSKKSLHQTKEDRFESDSQKQYERCMVDSPEMLEYKNRKDLTIDEMAELRCKPFACRLQLCMSKPKIEKPIHKDVYTGELYTYNDPCKNAYPDFFACVESEKKNILSEKLP